MLQYEAGDTVPVGPSVATIYPDMDFETYSEAGFVWTPVAGYWRFDKRKQQQVWVEPRFKWSPPVGATQGGISAVGAAAYAAHPSTEVICFHYDLKDGLGPRFWRPGLPNPVELFEYLAAGGEIEAHHAGFEYWIWNRVCTRLYGWPTLQVESLRDSMAKAQAWALPGSLDKISDVLDLTLKKDPEGKRLIKKFSTPRNPTKNDPRIRIQPWEDPDDVMRYYQYNRRDIEAEGEASSRIPDLPPEELDFWQSTFRMNVRGVALDMAGVEACRAVLDQALETYNAALPELTDGIVEKASQVQRIGEWLGRQGFTPASLADATVAEILKRTDLPNRVRQVLDIRQRVGSASVKKLYAMLRQSVDGTLHDLFVYHRARTGRDGAEGVQPQNAPKAGPKLYACNCGQYFGTHHTCCPFCGSVRAPEAKKWHWEMVEPVLAQMQRRSLEWVEWLYGDALLAISGCIRGLFVARPGKEFICSDYSAIEAVVTAMIAGEEWRIEAFRQRKPIYLLSASAITGTPVEEYEAFKERTGDHHPDRQKIGKVAELGLGFGGWIGAWRQFDDTDTFTDEEVKQLIIKWRNASPAIVELWGGQVRGKPWDPERLELYGLEGAAIAAVQDPGQAYSYRLVSYKVVDDVLYCRIPSGRLLAYHRPRLSPSTRWEGQASLSFEGYNTNPKMGPIGWVRMHTYGGRLTENVVQATARDFMRDGALRLERAGYPIVLRVHDELIAEVPEGYGSIEEFEAIMAAKPEWAKDWPIFATDGWRGTRYRKD